jgi:hypothetical protein
MTERNTELPLVRVAVTCENVIEDKRDGTLSLIKIIDQVTIYRRPGAPPAPEVMEPTAITVVMVIGTVADKARGQRSLTVHVIAPDGTVRPVGLGGDVLRVDYEEASATRNWIVRLSLMASAIGTFWLEVRCDGQPLTRMPLRIAYEPNSTTGEMGG